MPFGDDETPEVTDEVAPVQDGASSDAGESNDVSSSETSGETKDEGLLGVLRDAVAEKPEAAAASPAEGEEPGQEPDAEEPKQQDDEDFSDVPFNKHPRFRKLLAERNANKEDAGQYRQVQTFLRDQGLTAKEAGDLLVTGALAKHDPVQAWKLVLPWVQNLAKAAGEVLPDELAQMVRDGAMTSEAALEVSRSRASVAASQASRSFEQQLKEARDRESAVTALRTEAETWEHERRERDPNFDAKVEPILKEIAYRQKVLGDNPQTPQEVRAQLNAIYKVVNANLAPVAAAPAVVRPAPPARRPITPVTGGSVAGNARPKPQSMLEVVQQAAGG